MERVTQRCCVENIGDCQVFIVKKRDENKQKLKSIQLNFQFISCNSYFVSSDVSLQSKIENWNFVKFLYKVVNGVKYASQKILK